MRPRLWRQPVHADLTTPSTPHGAYLTWTVELVAPELHRWPRGSGSTPERAAAALVADLDERSAAIVGLAAMVEAVISSYRDEGEA